MPRPLGSGLGVSPGHRRFGADPPGAWPASQQGLWAPDEGTELGSETRSRSRTEWGLQDWDGKRGRVPSVWSTNLSSHLPENSPELRGSLEKERTGKLFPENSFRLKYK